MDSKIYNLKFVHSPPSQFDTNTLYVQKFAEDTVGTTFGASWVYVFSEKHDKKVALYKPLDYDEPLGAYAELLYSNIAQLCFNNIKIRVPKINLVIENNNVGILSYSIVDRITEDLIHIEALMSYKYKKNPKQQRNIFTLGISDIFESVLHEVHDEKNFIELQKSIIFTILLDSFTNNVDRHQKNWGLVRDKTSNYYELAIFDNVKSFINMFYHRAGYKNSDLWAITYNGTISSLEIEVGNQACAFIKKEYPEYFCEFITNLKTSKEIFISDISSIPKLEPQRIDTMLKKKIKYFSETNQEEV